MITGLRLFAVGIVAAGSIIGTGYWSGLQTRRWGTPLDLKQIGAQIESIPMKVGAWEGEPGKPIREDALKVLQCEGYTMRQYTGAGPQDRVICAVLFGPPGPISLHDPDVCYTGAGYKREHPPERVVIPINGEDVSLWSVTLKPREIGEPRLKVIWGWYDGKRWSAPKNARFHFAGKRFLVKLQVAHPIDDYTAASDDSTERFIKEFIPAVNEELGKAIKKQPEA